jgi:hypothetical protein
LKAFDGIAARYNEVSSRRLTSDAPHSYVKFVSLSAMTLWRNSGNSGGFVFRLSYSLLISTTN